MTILGEDNMQILAALLAEEEQYHVTSDYMDAETGIGPEHRHFLVSWMMTVQSSAPFPLLKMTLPADGSLCAGDCRHTQGHLYRMKDGRNQAAEKHANLRCASNLL